MDKLTHAHWTQHSTKDFIYSISSNFVAQIEAKLEESGINQNSLADKMNKSNGRISQVLNNPGNLSIRSMVELVRALGMKVSIVAYDDHDPDNTRGPIDPDVFVKCWESADRPIDLFEVEAAFGTNAVQSFARFGTAYMQVDSDLEHAMNQTLSRFSFPGTVTQQQFKVEVQAA